MQANFLAFQGFDKFNRIFSLPSGLSFMRFVGKTHINNSKYGKIKNYFSDPAGAFHFLSKTQILKGAYKAALKSKIFQADLLDILVNIIIYSKTNILKTKNIFHMHQYHEKSEAHQRLSHILIKNKFNKQKYELIKIISKKLILKKNLFENDFNEFLSKISSAPKRPYNYFYIYIKNILLNKFLFKFIFKKYFFNKALNEKNSFVKSNKVKQNDFIFINKVYSFYIKNYYQNTFLC